MVPYIITDSSITAFLKGKSYAIPHTHPNFSKIKDTIRDQGSEDDLLTLVDIPQAIRTFGQGKVEVTDGVVFYNGAPLHNVLTERMLRMMNEGFDINPMAKFLENLMQNPSRTAVEELYLFMEQGQLPLTADGHFLAYKKVRDDYGSYYDNGQTKNLPGTVVEMVRNKVDDNRERTCSYGLHFCSEGYLPHYYGSEGKVVILKINPADVVSIPSDYNNAKGRACKYTVIGTLDYDFSKENMGQAVFEEASRFDDEGDTQSDYIAYFSALTNDGDFVTGTATIRAGDQLDAEEQADELDVSSITWEYLNGLSVQSHEVDADTIRVKSVD